MKYLIPVTLLAILIASCAEVKKEPQNDLCFKGSFSQKIEDGSFNDTQRLSQLNSKFIEIAGVFRYGFEDIALYPTATGKTTEALWTNFRLPVSVTDSMMKTYDGKNVIFIGKLNTRSKGHLGEYFAELDSVFCIKLQ